MTPTDRLLAALRAHGHDPHRSGEGWTCRCPAHDDREPSLSIGTGDDGRALVHCHARCEPGAILAAIGMRPADLFADAVNRSGGHAKPRRSVTVTNTPRKPRHNTGSGDGDARTFPTARDAVAALERTHGPRSAHWTYHDAAGEPVGVVLRWDRPGGRKDIRPVSLTGDGVGWTVGAMPTPRPLYGLPRLRALPRGSRVYVVEGERVADAARTVGLAATTSPGGSAAARKADWSPLAGQDVVILPDHDSPGERYAADVVRLALSAGAASVRIVRLVAMWPDLPAGGDMVDLLAHFDGDAARTRREVEALTDATEPTTPGAERDGPAAGDGAAVIVRLSDVTPEPIRWLWPGRIALSKVTLIAGDPGLGKSFVTLDITARVTRGAPWPDARDVPQPVGGVVLLSAEDGIADTIRPRLDAAGADVARIVALEAVRAIDDEGRESRRTFDLGRDLFALAAAIETAGDCRLVVVDPISAYLGATDSHKNGDVRGLLAPLADLAARTGVAIVAITHNNKATGGPAIYRAMGSLAFVAAARAAWAVTRDRDDPRRRLLLPLKNNIAPDTGGLAYRVQPQPIGGSPVVTWEDGAVTVSADDALSGDRDSDGRTERDDAADWLRDLLAPGPRTARDVEREARDAGIALATLRRAKAAIGVGSRKPAWGGAWEWALPTPAQDAHAPNMLTQDAHPPASERLRAKRDENDGESPKAFTSDGVSALCEGLGSGAHLGDGGSESRASAPPSPNGGIGSDDDAGDGWGQL